MPVSIGIDLGTTFSAVALVRQGHDVPEIVPNTEGKRITPSVIQFIDGKPTFGSDAESAFKAGEPDCVTTFKRDMGKTTPYCEIEGKEYTSEDLSSMLLGHLVAGANAVLGDDIEEVVITVPAYFHSIEREATLNAAKRAGLKVKKLIDEPNAAVMAYGQMNFRENANILVYDLGGGTFDVSLVRMEPGGILETKTTLGDHKLGGKDWDGRLMDLMAEKYSDASGNAFDDDSALKNMIRGIAEEIKRELSQLKAVKNTYKKQTISVSQEEFESACKDLLDRTGNLCLDVVKRAGLSISDITDILLVGGSTRMPQVKKYLKELFGKEPISHVNPDEVVALGAAIQATKENDKYEEVEDFNIHLVDGKLVDDRKILGDTKNQPVSPPKKLSANLIILHETTAHAMGIIAISPDRTRYINDIIIPANHRRPVRVAKAFGFQTSPRGANEMEIYVLQGDFENPLANQIPYKYVVSGIRHIQAQKGKTTIRVQYSYDNHGIIRVAARQESDSVNLPIRKEEVPDDMSKYERPINPNDFLETEPLSVVLAIDVSGSMYGNPLAEAKKAMCGFVRKMDFSNTKVSIVAVADDVAKVADLTDNEEDCINAIDTIQVGLGGGNSGHPFTLIKEILENQEGKRCAIVLADGVWSYQDKAIAASKGCNVADIDTASIGFGSADKKFLQDISNTEAHLVSQSELTQAFGTIAQSLGGNSASVGNDGSVSNAETWDDSNE